MSEASTAGQGPAAPKRRTARDLTPDEVNALIADNFTAVLLGKVDAVTAMVTNKLKVSGSMAYMMRNVPTVLDFVRCAREITTEIL